MPVKFHGEQKDAVTPSAESKEPVGLENIPAADSRILPDQKEMDVVAAVPLRERFFSQKIQWVLEEYFPFAPDVLDPQAAIKHNISLCCKVFVLDLLIALIKKYFPKNYSKLLSDPISKIEFNTEDIELIKLAALFKHTGNYGNFSNAATKCGYDQDKIKQITTALTQPGDVTIYTQLVQDACDLIPVWEGFGAAISRSDFYFLQNAKRNLKESAFTLASQELQEISQYWHGLLAFLIYIEYLPYYAEHFSFFCAVENRIHLYRLWTTFDFFSAAEFAALLALGDTVVKFFPMDPLVLSNPTINIAEKLFGPKTKVDTVQKQKVESPYFLGLIKTIQDGKDSKLDTFDCSEIVTGIQDGTAVISVVREKNNIRQGIFLAFLVTFTYKAGVPKFWDVENHKSFLISELLFIAEIYVKPLLPLSLIHELGLPYEGADYERFYLSQRFNHFRKICCLAPEEKSLQSETYEFNYDQFTFGDEKSDKAFKTDFFKVGHDSGKSAKVFLQKGIPVFCQDGQSYYDSRKIFLRVKRQYYEQKIQQCQEIIASLEMNLLTSFGIVNLEMNAQIGISGVVMEVTFKKMSKATSKETIYRESRIFLDLLGVNKTQNREIHLRVSDDLNFVKILIFNPPPMDVILEKLERLTKDSRLLKSESPENTVTLHAAPSDIVLPRLGLA